MIVESSSELATQSVWPVDRIKDNAVKIGSGVTPSGGAASYLDSGIPLLRSQNVHFDGLRLDDVAYIAEETHEEMNGTKLRARDVLLNITGASIGRCAFVPDGFGEGNVNQHVCIIRPAAKLNYKFLTYCLSAPWGQDQVFSSFTGASRQGLGQRDLGGLQVPLPPLPEQERIAAYLDASCAAIDAAVAAKRRQLETLDALRKTTIHRAVTQGLDPDAKMKSAGADWLSEVPAHWTPSRVKNVAKLSPGYSGRPPANDELCTFVPMENLSEAGTLDTTSLLAFEDVSGGLTLFEVGDVLFAKITPCMENGKGAFVESLPSRYAFGSTEFHVLRPAYAIKGKFLYYYTYNPIFRAYAAENMSGAAGQKRVSSRFLKETRLFVPPLPEQLKIISFLTAKDKEFRTLFAQIEAQIATLTAYRKSLIHECITGQRRVTESDVSRAVNSPANERMAKAHGA